MGLVHALEQLLAPRRAPQPEREQLPEPPPAEPPPTGGGAVGDLPTGQLRRELDAEQRAERQHAEDVAREEQHRSEDRAHEEQVRAEERTERQAEAAAASSSAEPAAAAPGAAVHVHVPAASSPSSPPRIVAEHPQPSSGGSQVEHTVAVKHPSRK